MTTVVRAVDPGEVAARHAAFAAFERAFAYPLGGDVFRIDHGSDYLAFFRALGEPRAFVAEEDGRVRGVLVAVRRAILGREAWYLCDLKVAPDAAGLGRNLLGAFMRAHLRPETSAYGVSMDAVDGSNRLARVMARLTPGLRTQRLAVYALDYDAWARLAPALERNAGPIGFLDLRGVKDIVLESTGGPMPLLHAQWGPLARGPLVPPRPGFTHMFALPESDVIDAEPHATATLILRGMDWFDPRLVLTSDV